MQQTINPLLRKKLNDLNISIDYISNDYISNLPIRIHSGDNIYNFVYVYEELPQGTYTALIQDEKVIVKKIWNQFEFQMTQDDCIKYLFLIYKFLCDI